MVALRGPSLLSADWTPPLVLAMLAKSWGPIFVGYVHRNRMSLKIRRANPLGLTLALRKAAMTGLVGHTAVHYRAELAVNPVSSTPVNGATPPNSKSEQTLPIRDMTFSRLHSRDAWNVCF